MMLSLYGLFFLMLIVALGMIAIPFFQKGRFKSFAFIAVLFSGLALGLYQLTGEPGALKRWLNGGEEHYKLVQTFEKLGGVHGAILQIRQRLEQNPDDKQGWKILGKLYLSIGEKQRAAEAFAKAGVQK